MVTDAMKKAQTKYREKNIDKYNEKQRSYYNNNKSDPDWKIIHNAKCRLGIYNDIIVIYLKQSKE